MSQKKFSELKRDAYASDLSPFAQFCQETKGYEFSLNRIQLDKWEVYWGGYTDAVKVINGSTPILAIKK